MRGHILVPLTRMTLPPIALILLFYPCRYRLRDSSAVWTFRQTPFLLRSLQIHRSFEGEFRGHYNCED